MHLHGTNDPNAKPAAWDFANAGDDDYPLFEGKESTAGERRKRRPRRAVYPGIISKTTNQNKKDRA